jgi:hypothetical protein
MINEHDIKDWWLTDRLKDLQKEVEGIKQSEGSYSSILKDLDFLKLEISVLRQDVYDRLGYK